MGSRERWACYRAGRETGSQREGARLSGHETTLLSLDRQQAPYNYLTSRSVSTGTQSIGMHASQPYRGLRG